MKWIVGGVAGLDQQLEFGGQLWHQIEQAGHSCPLGQALGAVLDRMAAASGSGPVIAGRSSGTWSVC
ncbi:hypothetical protein [Streptomyces sp. SD31]|uniref:hypothetical protein n=1 Tax=Streptomyces sp. SD31 TaxID=3452208 RepID=UPI003F88AA09